MAEALLTPACRICGCTDITACLHDNGTPCAWAEDDLCSVCQDLALTPALMDVQEEIMRLTCGKPEAPHSRRAILVHEAAQLVRAIDALDQARKASTNG